MPSRVYKGVEYHRINSKYRNQKIEYGNAKFDSKKEAKRYAELQMLEKCGEISNLRTQVRYELIPSQKKDGKVLERPVTYIADFVYKDKAGEEVVEDVKGYKEGQAYNLFKVKRKLMLYRYGIEVKET